MDDRIEHRVHAVSDLFLLRSAEWAVSHCLFICKSLIRLIIKQGILIIMTSNAKLFDSNFKNQDVHSIDVSDLQRPVFDFHTSDGASEGLRGTYRRLRMGCLHFSDLHG